MKILFITNNFPPIADGVGDYTYNLAKEFVKHKHEVHILLKKNKFTPTSYSPFTVLPIIKRWDLKANIQIIKYINQNEIDCVLLQYVPHGFHSKGIPLCIGLLTKKLHQKKIPLLCFFHEVCINYKGINLKRYFISRTMIYIAKMIIKNSNYIATSIDHYKNEIIKISKTEKKIHIIPIASNVVFNEPQHLICNKTNICSDNDFIIAFFGNRDYTTCLYAINKLLKQNYKIKVLVIGNTKINKTIIPNDKIIETGVLPCSELSKYLQISDCIVLPENKNSGCSFKSGSLAAALQTRRPIISVNGFMTSDQLKDKKNILFVNPDDETDYINAIASIISNKDFKEYIGNNAFQIGKEINWDSTYRKYKSIIEPENE